MVAVSSTPFWNCLEKHLLFSTAQRLLHVDRMQWTRPLFSTYIHLLLIYTTVTIYYFTFLVHVPFTAQPQPPPFKLVASLSTFLLCCLCLRASFLPSWDRSKTEFLKLLNIYTHKQNCSGNCGFPRYQGRGGFSNLFRVYIKNNRKIQMYHSAEEFTT